MGKNSGRGLPKPDLSVLSQSKETAFEGFQSVLKCWQNGTDDVKRFLEFECDIIFECRVCRGFFRSAINYISHKRMFCKGTYGAISANASILWQQFLDSHPKDLPEKTPAEEKAVKKKERGHRDLIKLINKRIEDVEVPVPGTSETLVVPTFPFNERHLPDKIVGIADGGPGLPPEKIAVVIPVPTGRPRRKKLPTDIKIPNAAELDPTELETLDKIINYNSKLIKGTTLKCPHPRCKDSRPFKNFLIFGYHIGIKHSKVNAKGKIDCCYCCNNPVRQPTTYLKHYLKCHMNLREEHNAYRLEMAKIEGTRKIKRTRSMSPDVAVDLTIEDEDEELSENDTANEEPANDTPPPISPIDLSEPAPGGQEEDENETPPVLMRMSRTRTRTKRLSPFADRSTTAPSIPAKLRRGNSPRAGPSNVISRSATPLVSTAPVIPAAPTIPALVIKAPSKVIPRKTIDINDIIDKNIKKDVRAIVSKLIDDVEEMHGEKAELDEIRLTGKKKRLRGKAAYLEKARMVKRLKEKEEKAAKLAAQAARAAKVAEKAAETTLVVKPAPEIQQGHVAPLPILVVEGKKGQRKRKSLAIEPTEVSPESTAEPSPGSRPSRAKKRPDWMENYHLENVKDDKTEKAAKVPRQESPTLPIKTSTPQRTPPAPENHSSILITSPMKALAKQKTPPTSGVPSRNRSSTPIASSIKMSSTKQKTPPPTRAPFRNRSSTPIASAKLANTQQPPPSTRASSRNSSAAPIASTKLTTAQQIPSPSAGSSGNSVTSTPIASSIKTSTTTQLAPPAIGAPSGSRSSASTASAKSATTQQIPSILGGSSRNRSSTALPLPIKASITTQGSIPTPEDPSRSHSSTPIVSTKPTTTQQISSTSGALSGSRSSAQIASAKSATTQQLPSTSGALSGNSLTPVASAKLTTTQIAPPLSGAPSGNHSSAPIVPAKPTTQQTPITSVKLTSTQLVPPPGAFSRNISSTPASSMKETTTQQTLSTPGPSGNPISSTLAASAKLTTTQLVPPPTGAPSGNHSSAPIVPAKPTTQQTPIASAKSATTQQIPSIPGGFSRSHSSTSIASAKLTTKQETSSIPGGSSGNPVTSTPIASSIKTSTTTLLAPPAIGAPSGSRSSAPTASAKSATTQQIPSTSAGSSGQNTTPTLDDNKEVSDIPYLALPYEVVEASSRRAAVIPSSPGSSRRKQDMTLAMDKSEALKIKSRKVNINTILLTSEEKQLYFNGMAPNCPINEFSAASDINIDSGYTCKYCSEFSINLTDARRHMFSHVRAQRIICKLCGVGAVYALDIKRHLFERYCPKLENAPFALKNGIPCMTTEQAENLIEFVDKIQPGKVQIFKGDIISYRNLSAHQPCFEIEQIILKPMEDRKNGRQNQT